MTRETKISLLVGLAFFIVMGILLTDHLRMAGEPPQAALADAGANVRDAAAAPGESGEPPIRMAPPVDASPKESVPTRDELTRPAPPVIVSKPEDHGADMPELQSPLADVAHRNGESLVPANIDGSSKNSDANDSSPAPEASSGPKQYRAQPGDTVSRMAAKFMGSNSRENRQAIINANPSLQDDPDRVIVGQMYVIPTSGKIAMAPAPSPENPTPSPEASGQEYFYVVQDGDSLWRIANDELGDPSAVDAIKELNQSVLRGKDTVIPGMKLRLPSKPVAAANSSM